jgi:hypothetical protein
LLASAKPYPSQTFNVIIQGDPDKPTGAIAPGRQGRAR